MAEKYRNNFIVIFSQNQLKLQQQISSIFSYVSNVYNTQFALKIKMQVTQPLPLVKKSSSKMQQKQPSQWQSLVNSLVRPPRMRYNECSLGYKNFSLKNQQFTRSDQTIIYAEGKRLFLSIFNPLIKNNKLILYLHGNSSSKLQSKPLLAFLPEGYSLASFDFLGCGNNVDEDKITLGFDQSKQVQTVVTYLRERHYQVYLWGRSMGAVSAIRYGKADVIVADSPFRSMKKLCKQLSSSNINPLPNIVVSCLFPCVFMKLKSDIQKKGHYNLDELDIEKSIKSISPTTTLIFLCGDHDELIHHRNSQKLFESFPGQKKYLQIVPGNHNSRRPDHVIQKIMKIIDNNSGEHEPIQQFIKHEPIQLQL